MSQTQNEVMWSELSLMVESMKDEYTDSLRFLDQTQKAVDDLREGTEGIEFRRALTAATIMSKRAADDYYSAVQELLEFEESEND